MGTDGQLTGHEAPGDEGARTGEAQRLGRPKSNSRRARGPAGGQRGRKEGLEQARAGLATCTRRESGPARASREKLSHAHLPSPAHGARARLDKEVRATSVAVPGRGSHRDRAKLEAAMGRRGLASLVHGRGRLGASLSCTHMAPACLPGPGRGTLLGVCGGRLGAGLTLSSVSPGLTSSLDSLLFFLPEAGCPVGWAHLEIS